MVSEISKTMVKKTNAMGGKSGARKSFPNKKNPGKVSRKIHKAEREKLKRDQLNELFTELGYTLEPARQNNGKASILGETTRLLQDLLKQVECLRRENKALLTESNYISEEKNELRDEKAVLEADIEKLQKDLLERIQSGHIRSNASDPTQPLSNIPIKSQQTNSALQSDEAHIHLPAVRASAVPLGLPPVMRQMIVFPLHPDLQTCQESSTVVVHPSKPQIRRPQARYPTPSDSWPSQLLAKQPGTAQETQVSNGDGGEDCSGSFEDFQDGVERES